MLRKDLLLHWVLLQQHGKLLLHLLLLSVHLLVHRLLLVRLLLLVLLHLVLLPRLWFAWVLLQPILVLWPHPGLGCIF